MESSKTKKNKHIFVLILFSAKMEIFIIYCLTFVFPCGNG